MYQVGQAVIYWGNRIAFFHTKWDPHYGYTLQDFNGKLSYYHSIDRPATEAEILAEAVKHGWTVDYMSHLNSPMAHCILVKAGDWYLGNNQMAKPSTENLKEYCEEGLIADRLITALNLSK